jgi:N-formylglutamate amidohydrolase
MVAAVAAGAVCGVLAACGAGETPAGPGPGPRVPAAIMEAGGDGQQGAVANALATDPAILVVDDAGRPLAGVAVTFTVAAGDGWTTAHDATTDASGRAATSWYLGPKPGTEQRLRAAAGAGLAFEFTASALPLEPGRTYHGAGGYVEFTAGDLPLIVAAPHGGTLTPAAIPDRTGAGITTIRDANTDLLAHDVRDAFIEGTAAAPHVVIVNLHRIKLDANREIVEAALGNAAAERAWREYHAFIEAARERVVEDHGRGFYIDLHGHGHAIQRLELGYLLSAADLEQDDATLNSSAFVARSSVRTLAQVGLHTHADLIRGPLSLGSLFSDQGYPAVPSTEQPHPGGAPYFTGGYNTRRHGSRDGGTIDAVQIEANMTGVRDTAANRRLFADRLVDVMRTFFAENYGFVLEAPITH